VPFVFLPVSTRILFGLLGFIILVLKISQHKIKFTLDKRLFIFFILLFTILLISLVSIGINQTNDIEFIKYPVSVIIILFASYFVAKVLNNFYKDLDFKNISLLIVNVIFIQSIISFMMFLVPDLRDILIGIQRISPDDMERMSDLFEFRLIGFGTMFFGAGIINGFALLLIGILLRNYKLSKKQIISLSFKFSIILILGMMMSRTTIIGGILSILLIFFPQKIKIMVSMVKKKVLFIISSIFIPLIISLILYLAVPNINQTVESGFNFAFELFMNYYENGNIETKSTNRLKEMYVFPASIKTWIIGDGYWSNPTGKGYYMQTDVGYLRLIYYFGCIGLGIYIFYQYYLVRITFSIINEKVFMWMVFVYFLILNLKGFSDLSSFIMLFLITNKIKTINK
jgi:hypothetical protein